MRAEAAEVMAGAYVAAKGRRGESGAAIPLLGVNVVAEITGPTSRVVMRQRFRNEGTKPIEAVYVFPAPEKAAVTGLVIETGGRRIVGTVKEKEQAFDVYDEALAAGHGAVLLDAHRPNVFQASVGNLAAGQEMVVELELGDGARLGGRVAALRAAHHRCAALCAGRGSRRHRSERGREAQPADRLRGALRPRVPGRGGHPRRDRAASSRPRTRCAGSRAARGRRSSCPRRRLP